MKTNKLNTILSGVAAIATAAIFLFLIGTGLSFNNGLNLARGYDLMFGNDALGLEAIPAFIAVFVFLIVTAVFSVLSAVFHSIGDERTTHKFCAFLLVVAGLLSVASTIIFFLSPLFIDKVGVTASLGWAVIVSGILSAISAVATLFAGVKGFLAK